MPADLLLVMPQRRAPQRHIVAAALHAHGAQRPSAEEEDDEDERPHELPDGAYAWERAAVAAVQRGCRVPATHPLVTWLVIIRPYRLLVLAVRGMGGAGRAMAGVHRHGVHRHGTGTAGACSHAIMALWSHPQPALYAHAAAVPAGLHDCFAPVARARLHSGLHHFGHLHELGETERGGLRQGRGNARGERCAVLHRSCSARWRHTWPHDAHGLALPCCQQGEASAYSLFNPGVRALPGELDAQQLDTQIRAGQM